MKNNNILSPRDRDRIHRVAGDFDRDMDKGPPRKRNYSPMRRQVSDERHVWYSGAPRSFNKGLVVRNLSLKINDVVVEDTIVHEYEAYGELSVQVCSSENERYAILNFKYADDARNAFMNKSKVPIGNRIYDVEVNENFGAPDYQSNNRQSNRRYQNPQNSRAFFHNTGNNSSNMGAQNQLISQQQQSVLSALGLNPAAFQLFPGLAPGTMDFLDGNKKMYMNNPPHVPKNMPGNVNPGNSNAMNNNVSVGRYGGGNQSNYHSNSSRVNAHEMDLRATRTLFVGSLESDIQEHEVLAAFSPFGHIEQIDIKRQVELHSYSFVRFENVDMAMRAKSQMSGRCVRTLHCKIGFGKPVVSNCLYIGGLGGWVRQDGLEHLLYRYGTFTFFFFEPNTSFAILMYTSEDSATEAVQKLNGFCLGRQERSIYVDYLATDIVELLIQNKVQITQILSSDSHRSLSATFSIREMTFFKTASSGANVNNDPYSHGRRQRLDSGRNEPPSSSSAQMSSHTGVKSIKSAMNLSDLEQVCAPPIAKMLFCMKQSVYPFRCLHVAGNRDLTEEMKETTLKIGAEEFHGLQVDKRILMQPDWMAEAADLISKVLEGTEKCKLSILLALPEHTSTVTLAEVTAIGKLKAVDKVRPIPCLIAYLRHKQSACVVHLPPNKSESHGKLLYVYPPSSFSLSILKSAAYKLGCDLATMNTYLVLLLCKV